MSRAKSFRTLLGSHKVLDAMAAAGVDGNDETYEWLANAAVRGVDFVTVRLVVSASGATSAGALSCTSSQEDMMLAMPVPRLGLFLLFLCPETCLSRILVV